MILPHDLLTNPRTASIFAALPRTRRIVDVGCGIRPCPIFPVEEYVCIEPHDEYVAELRKWDVNGANLTIVQDKADALANQPRFDTTVLLLDVIEHMEKPAGERIRDLLAEFHHAVIFTPLGWYEQGDANPDAWGYNGGYWQKHRSAWQPEDFKGWSVNSWKTWHVSSEVGAILAVR